MDLYDIKEDLTNALQYIDRNNYVLNSTLLHLEEQCTPEEVKLVEKQIYELESKEYDTREEFISDYQPIFDLVDFPFKECFSILEKRTLNLDEI